MGGKRRWEGVVSFNVHANQIMHNVGVGLGGWQASVGKGVRDGQVGGGGWGGGGLRSSHKPTHAYLEGWGWVDGKRDVWKLEHLQEMRQGFGWLPLFAAWALGSGCVNLDGLRTGGPFVHVGRSDLCTCPTGHLYTCQVQYSW